VSAEWGRRGWWQTLIMSTQVGCVAAAWDFDAGAAAFGAFLTAGIMVVGVRG